MKTGWMIGLGVLISAGAEAKLATVAEITAKCKGQSATVNEFFSMSEVVRTRNTAALAGKSLQDFGLNLGMALNELEENCPKAAKELAAYKAELNRAMKAWKEAQPAAKMALKSKTELLKLLNACDLTNEQRNEISGSWEEVLQFKGIIDIRDKGFLGEHYPSVTAMGVGVGMSYGRLAEAVEDAQDSSRKRPSCSANLLEMSKQMNAHKQHAVEGLEAWKKSGVSVAAEDADDTGGAVDAK